ncbi:AAA family ATPase [Catenisphaera adipataccumulans]|uniref:Cytidylate kinase n=1 Tax=Catenisphaera adipataccumulans TaxID=700500 RepID=A0A7W8CXI7_9FIRM|nr:cytidylate kinase-like family protein [Catenisphaera adipataccumulans]MBB5182759.1 cytidylate kinase [Catenisphaera adipataccumulans]
MNRIITISREFGSGGRTIGKKVAEQLGIPCYDEELINRLAEASGMSEDFVKENSEYTVSGNWFANALAGRNMYGHSPQDDLWRIQSKIIYELAEKGPCVIVGRCADYLLRGKADCLTVFIHADPKFRAKRIVEVYGEREEAPLKRVKDKDKRRKAYYQFYTDSTWGDAENYHIALDSGVLGIDTCVDLIKRLY